MAILSIRLPDLLKNKTMTVAKHQGVSMNNFIICSISTAVVQQEAVDFFQTELKNVERENLSKQFNRIMSKTQKENEPDIEYIDKLIRK